MKKKLALLLAAVMTITSLPSMSVFASSTNRITGPSSISNRTVMFERGMVPGTGEVLGHIDLTRWTDGSNLTIEMNTSMQAGSTFRVELENAQWFFHSAANARIWGPLDNLQNHFAIEGGTGPWATTNRNFMPITRGMMGFATNVNDPFLWNHTDGGVTITIPESALKAADFTGSPLPPGLGTVASGSDTGSGNVADGNDFLAWLEAAALTTWGGTSPNPNIVQNLFGTAAGANSADHAANITNSDNRDWTEAPQPSRGLASTVTAPAAAITRVSNFGESAWTRIFAAAKDSVPNSHGSPPPPETDPRNFLSEFGTVTLLSRMPGARGTNTERNRIVIDDRPTATTVDQDALITMAATYIAGAMGPVSVVPTGNDLIVTISVEDLEAAFGGGAIPSVSFPLYYFISNGSDTVDAGRQVYGNRAFGVGTTATDNGTFLASWRDTFGPGGSISNPIGDLPFRRSNFRYIHDLGDWVRANAGYDQIVPGNRATALPIDAARYAMNGDGGFLTSLGDGRVQYTRVTANSSRALNNSNELSRVDATVNAGSDIDPIHLRQVPYNLVIQSATARREATVTTITNAVRGSIITIPLVALTSSDGDIRIRVISDISEVSGGPLLISAAADGRTNSLVENLTITRDIITIGRYRIDELRANSIRSNNNWQFELRAPRGYEFRSDRVQHGNQSINTSAPFGVNPRDGQQNRPDDLKIYTTGGLLWSAEVLGGGAATPRSGYMPGAGEATRANIDDQSNGSTWSTSLAPIAVNFRPGRNDTLDRTTLRIDVRANTFTAQTTTGTGSLYIQNMQLQLEDYDALPDGQQIFINQSNTVGSVLTNQQVLVTTARDYDIVLSYLNNNDVPLLISGRLEGAETRADGFGNMNTTVGRDPNWRGSDRIRDTYHQAASVRFEERVPDAWWAQRSTTFELPEGVHYLKVEFEDVRRMGVNEGARAAEAQELYAGTVNTGRDNGRQEPWYNTGTRLGKVQVDNNRLVLSSFAVNPNERAQFDMHIWLNIQVDFEGDIDMVLKADAFRQIRDNYDVAITIARAIRPIEIHTEVSEARVGFQFISVADFDIVETRAGNLLQGEDVRITATDLSAGNNEVRIATGFRANVTEGNIRIGTVREGNSLGTGLLAGGVSASGLDAHLAFIVERESTVAATISFSDVQITVDRRAPFSNPNLLDGRRGYDLHVWGGAVARNFIGLYERQQVIDDGMNVRDLFNVGSISVPYIHIATPPAESAQTGFINHVRVTIDSTTVMINEESHVLEVAPYISTASNSAMVPVRFIANALGLPQEAVTWHNADRRVVIDAGSRMVAFVIGDTNYYVNGTPVPMVSPDGLPVAAEITNERTFVPFRALGNAFGIPINWEPDTRTAVFNQPDGH